MPWCIILCSTSLSNASYTHGLGEGGVVGLKYCLTCLGEIKFVLHIYIWVGPGVRGQS